MATRHEDWHWQAKRDLEHAQASAADGFYEWASFAAQQAAEKALKAVFQRRGADAWGHVLTELLEALASETPVPGEVVEAAKELDKHYIAPRYPNALPGSAPGQVYTAGEAERAIENADRVLRFCEGHLL
jgi:HEPN domain-containing protein